MKTTPVCPILASILALSPLTVAQERQAAGDGDWRAKAKDRTERMWKEVDKDRDGAISRDEFSQMPRLTKLAEDQRQALFDRLDKDQDDQIVPSEMNQGKPGPAPGQRMPKIWDLDTDRDGGISFGELQQGRMFERLDPERQKRIFNRLDSNGDGKITPDDKPKMRPRPEGADRDRPEEGMRAPRDGDAPKPPHAHPRGLIGHLDKNGDGSLTLDEFSASERMKDLEEAKVRERFEKLDRNGDGKVNREDMQRRDMQRRPGQKPNSPETQSEP